MEYESLRPRQKNAIHELRKHWKSSDSFLINAPCGFGKTVLAAYLCNMLSKSGLRVVFTAPYITLVEQTYTRFKSYGMSDPSVIWQDDPRYNRSNLVQIASSDTLIARDMDDVLGNVDVIIIDECDLWREKLYEWIQVSGKKLIGLTATPYAPWLGKYYETFIKPGTTQELISEGLLVPFRITAPNLEEARRELEKCKTRMGEYKESDSERVMTNEKIMGDVLENWLENGENRSTIGFAPNKATANAYCRKFKQAGIESDVIVDKTPVEEREIILERYRQKIVKVIWNVGVLGAGLDEDVRCIIWVKPTKSERSWVQGTLRGSRTADGKEDCFLFDHTNSFWELGDPTKIEYYSLSEKDHKDRKVEREEEIKHERSAVCLKCGHEKEQYICEKCGHKPLGGEEMEGIDNVELIDVEEREKKKDEKQRFYSELLGYQLLRNYTKPVSDGWVAHKFKEKFKEWPNGLKKIPVEPSNQMKNWIKSRQIKYAKGRAKAKEHLSKIRGIL